MKISHIGFGVPVVAVCMVVCGCGGKNEESEFNGPVTTAQAATVLDLSTFPVMEGLEPAASSKAVASLMYQAPTGDVKSVFEFQRKKLVSLGWKELPNSSITAEAGSAMFAKKGFVISVSVYPSGEGKKVSVLIQNHGNVKPGKLPVPPESKPVYVGDPSAMYVTNATPDATKEATRKLLTSAGWVSYGDAGDSAYYKQNAIRVTATVGPAPAQGGKTMISYSTELMSADVPAPPDATDMRYTESHHRGLDFETGSEQNTVVEFYKRTLGAAGWQPTLDHTVEISGQQEMIFRNPGKDMITLAMLPTRDGRSSVSVQFQSAAEVAELNRYVKEHAGKIRAKLKKEAEEEAANAQGSTAEAPHRMEELPKVAVTLPGGISGLERTKDEINFTVPHGKAKEVVEAVRQAIHRRGMETGCGIAGCAGRGGFVVERERAEFDDQLHRHGSYAERSDSFGGGLRDRVAVTAALPPTRGSLASERGEEETAQGKQA
jgi:hypothetical protein